MREYQLHDDVRYIDWNVTARLQVPHVREHNEDREITAWFLLDLSPSVDFGSMQVNKRTMLVEFTAVLARLLTRRGNRVGAIFYSGSSSDVIPAGSGRRHVLHILSRLERQPQLARAPATDLRECLEQAMRVVRRRSLVFLVSDFISRPGWERPLAHLARRHEILAVRLSDPLDLELPDLGLIAMRDSETGEQLLIDTHDRGFRERFAGIAREREALIRGGLQRAGVDALELSTQRRSGRCPDSLRRSAQAAQPPGRGPCPGGHGRGGMTFIWPRLLWLLGPCRCWCWSMCCCSGARGSSRCATPI